ncbi:MAG: hypothetical protein MUF51_11200 [Vicinamibacteria bacterium]|nr:hypothetical protein [Vicinamibacteria bacterium]
MGHPTAARPEEAGNTERPLFASPSEPERLPPGVKFLAGINTVLAALYFWATILLAMACWSDARDHETLVLLLLALIGLSAHAWTARGLAKLRLSARWSQTVLAALYAVLGYFAFPEPLDIRDLVAFAWLAVLVIPWVLVIVYMNQGGLQLLFSGRAFAAFSAQEAARVARVQGITVLGLLLPLGLIPNLLLLLLLVAVPRGHAPRSGNESAAIGDIRTMISAEAAYASLNNEHYAPPLCLSFPERCLPAYTGPSFIDVRMATKSERSGYRSTFYAGKAVAGGLPNRLESYAYTAVPMVPRKTGFRSFCGDSTGVVCFTTDGVEPRVQDGRCDLTVCRPIQ